MSIPILGVRAVEALEARIMAQGRPLGDLIHSAVSGCSLWIQEYYPASCFPSAGILAGSGHNGADALGIGCAMRNEGRSVIALVIGNENSLKPMTRSAAASLREAGGKVFFLNENNLNTTNSEVHEQIDNVSFWIDGLHGFGLNRPLIGLHAKSVMLIQNFNKPIVAIDLPSGLQADFGILPSSDPVSIQAHDTLALGCLKPAHVLDSCLHALGHVHVIDLGYARELQQTAQMKDSALEPADLSLLLSQARRQPASHKYKNGRVLIVAGSQRYPGAAVMTCMGAGISGAGMIHALVPEESRIPILTHVPEVIFESTLPELSSFHSIIIGPGWVPGEQRIFDAIINHVQNSPECACVFDAGAFEFLKQNFARGEKLNNRCVLTPHVGEFAQLFPEAANRMNTADSSLRLNTLQAAEWAAHFSDSVVYLKGARSCIASPDGENQVIFKSSPLLAHAGHGDVLAGVLGGLLASGLKTKNAAALAALLQATTALEFSGCFPAALTLPPSELVRRMLHLQLHGWLSPA